MNEVLLYGYIYGYSAESFINAVNALNEDELCVRVNTDGGEVASGWGMIAKYNEFEGEKHVKVDGKAYSMGAMICCYAKAENVQCLDVSQFMFHRAAYGDYYESNYMTDSEKESLVMMNKNLKTAFVNRIDVAKFEALPQCKSKNITVDSLFSMDSRQEVYLSATDAKKIGLVGSIVKITPEKQAEINAKVNSIVTATATASLIVNMPNQKPQPNAVNDSVNNKKQIKMDTLAELRAAHPNLVAQAVQEGVTQERERVNAWIALSEIDSPKALAGIKDGKDVTNTVITEFTVTAMKNGFKQTVEEEATATATAATATAEPPKTPESNAVNDWTNKILNAGK